MLSKKNRLKKKKDFEKVFRNGKGFKKDFLYLKTINNKNGLIRFGFVVSKSFSKKAVIRNKIKRRLSEIVRLELPKIKKGTDAVIMVMPQFTQKNFQKIKGLLDNLFKKSGILK